MSVIKWPPVGSIEEAALLMAPMPLATPEERQAALGQALLLLFYIAINLRAVSKPDGAGMALADVAMRFVDCWPQLAALAVADDYELPEVAND